MKTQTETRTEQRPAPPSVATSALLDLGLFVVEERARNRNKVLGPWKPTAAFVLESNAEAYLHRFKLIIGYMRLVRPNGRGEA
jgi:hypothetical protein